MKRQIIFFLLFSAIVQIFPPIFACSCSCHWRGPFLSVFRDALFVVHGRVIRHNAGRYPAIDIFVIETLSGGFFDSGMRILTGDGMYCRPEASMFPEGTEWIFAINGPGAKPGNTLAISDCGEYWLRVEGDDAVGSIDGGQDDIRKMPLARLKNIIRYPVFRQEIKGRVSEGSIFRAAFGSKFEFFLNPFAKGWEIIIREYGRDENLSRLTPPLHFLPNPREIEAWHIKASPPGCYGQYDQKQAPPFPREFVFSPEVGKSIDGPHATKSVTAEDINAVGRFGKGRFYVERFDSVNDDKGCPVIKNMEFRVFLEGGYK